MFSLNKVTLIGRLGKDPDIRMMQTSKEVCSFSLVTSETWKDKNTGEKTEKAEWHNIVIFNEALVRIAKQFLHKGSKVYIEGMIKTRKWVDNNSNDRYTTEIVLSGFNSVVIILDNKNSNDNNNALYKNDEHSTNSSQSTETEFIAGDIDDEIPF